MQTTPQRVAEYYAKRRNDPEACEADAMAIDDHDMIWETRLRDQADKVRENRLRRAAERQGLRLTRSRRRDPRAVDYGMYYLSEVTSPGTGWRSRALVSPELGMTLDEVEDFLSSS